jgi:hypothetical protein
VSAAFTVLAWHVGIGLPVTLVLALVDPCRNPYASIVFGTFFKPLAWPYHLGRYLHRLYKIRTSEGKHLLP